MPRKISKKKQKLNIAAAPKSIATNPFLDDYVLQEIKFYGIPKYNKDGIKIRTVDVIGRCDDFLNVNFRSDVIKCPQFYIDNCLWMTLTSMEIQSHYLPIRRARGKIAVGGLGMGYYLLKVMEKDTVNTIDVYECENRVVDFFTENFHDRKGFNKVKFIVGDIRKKMKKKKYNFAYIDIYPTILPDEVITDKELLTNNNQIIEYHFWCQEKMMKYAYEQGLLAMEDFSQEVLHLFSLWMQTKGSKLRDKDLGIDFTERCLETFGF